MMKKISVSVSEDVLQFIDSIGKNRSGTIMTILKHYKEEKEALELKQQYQEYAEFCKEDDKEWWKDWESTSAEDVGKGL